MLLLYLSGGVKLTWKSQFLTKVSVFKMKDHAGECVAGRAELPGDDDTPD